MKIESFDDALQFVSFARMTKDDLPDGQWEEVKEIVSLYRQWFGQTVSEWSEEIRKSFTDEIRQNLRTWI